MIYMPAWSRLDKDRSIVCIACNALIEKCSCIWAAVRHLQKDKDDIHRRLDNILELHRTKFIAIQDDICKLIDELQEHQKQPHQAPLYGKGWIQSSARRPGKESHATDAMHYLHGTNMNSKVIVDEPTCHHTWVLTTDVADMKTSWTQLCSRCKIVRGVDMAESKENPSRRVLEQKLHDKNLRIKQLQSFVEIDKKCINELECEIQAMAREITRLNKHIKKLDAQIPHGGCCL